MKTSDRGIAALELEEGVVLRAYRDPVGVWTIGAGLTAASGVVAPKAGMVISREYATALLKAALPKYEARVESAMPRANQNETDAAVSFDWNTGAVDRASWVKSWRARAGAAAIRAGMLLWCKGGGHVLPGLRARREREAAIMLEAVYRLPQPQPEPQIGYADWGLRLTPTEVAAAINGFRKLGYDAGTVPGTILRSSILRFQADFALTADGIIGRATLATLQRQLDARASAKAASIIVATPIATASLPAGTSTLVDQLLALPHAEAVLIGFGLLHAVLQAIHYRDAVAASPVIPTRLAKILRSF